MTDCLSGLLRLLRVRRPRKPHLFTPTMLATATTNDTQRIKRTMVLRSIKDETAIYAAYDRREEWSQCCAKAMGFEWVDCFDEDDVDDVDDLVVCTTDDEPNPVQQIINLLEDDEEEEDETLKPIARNEHEHESGIGGGDPWMENAHRIQTDVNRMTAWIKNKQHEYVSVDMSEEEASLIQSTVTTFLAATATDLETMRNMISNGSGRKNSSTSSAVKAIEMNSNLASHHAGVVQILLEQLKEQVAEPFNRLQRQRKRVAVQLWQNPLQCKLYQPKISTRGAPSSIGGNVDGSQNIMQQMFDDEEEEVEREQRFLPQRPVRMENNLDDFVSTYLNPSQAETRKKTMPPRRPQFVAQILEKQSKKRRVESERSDQSNQTTVGSNLASMNAPKNQVNKPKLMPYQQPQTQQHIPMAQPTVMSQEEHQRQVQNELQQEAALLQVVVNSDLESVQKVEQRMVEITTMISRFSDLVSEQQDDIVHIHETSKNVKENITKGKENLVDATDRTKQSKHYMAWSIFGMTLVLLFFHIIKG